jgi:hypothetical protein
MMEQEKNDIPKNSSYQTLSKSVSVEPICADGQEADKATTPTVCIVAVGYSQRWGKGKAKVVPVLYLLTDHHAMKAYWGVEV